MPPRTSLAPRARTRAEVRLRAHSQPDMSPTSHPSVAHRRYTLVVATDVEVLLPRGRDVLVVQVHRAVGLREDIGAVGVRAPDRQEAATEHAPEFPR